MDSKIYRPQNSVSPRISLKMQNLNACQEKSYRIILISGGTPPADFSTKRMRPPFPSAFGAHVLHFSNKNLGTIYCATVQGKTID